MIFGLSPSLNLAKPAGLRYSKGRSLPDVQVLRNEDGIKQIKTPQLLADVVIIDDFKYEIRFYDKEHWGSLDEGFYEPDTGNEFVVWVVENPDASTETYNRLRISRKVNGSCVRRSEYTYSTSGEDTTAWNLTRGDCSGSVVTSENKTTVEDSEEHTRTKTRIIKEGETTIYQRVDTLEEIAGRYILTRSEVGTSNPSVVTREYYTGAGAKNGKLRSWIDSDGAWHLRDYDASGRKSVDVNAWLDDAMPETADPESEVGAVTLYDYEPVDGQSDDTGTTLAQRPRTVIEKIRGTIVAKTYHVYYFDEPNSRYIEIEARAADPTAEDDYTNPDNLVTRREYYRAGPNRVPPPRLAKVEYPDGRVDTYTYENVSYTPNGGVPGTIDTGSGYLKVTATHEGPDGPVDYESTRTVTIRDTVGHEWLTKNYVYNGADYSELDWTVQLYDTRGRLTDVYRTNGSHVEYGWSNCCGLEYMVDETGRRTEYGYDVIGRLQTATRTGVGTETIGGVEYPAQEDVVTTYDYGATTDGFKLTQTTTGDGLSVSAFTQYDKAGRVIARQDASGLSTTTGYVYETNGSQTVTVTRPGGATEITAHWLDGSTKSVTGTGVVHRYFERGVSDGLRWSKDYTGPGLDSSPMWSKSTQDPLGRIVEHRRPGYDGGGDIVTTYAYYDDNDPGHAKGMLAKTETTGLADVLYVYDEMRHVARSGLDVDDDGSLDPDSTDRVTETAGSYYYDSTNWWRKSVTMVYAIDDDDTPTTVRQQFDLLTGFDTDEIARSKSIDVHGNETVTSTTIDRGTSDVNRLVIQTVNVPDSTTDQVTISRNGLFQRSTSSTGLLTQYAYDDLGRQTTVTDPRGHTVTTAYYTSGAGAKGKVKSTVDAAGNRTCYAYDADTGRQSTIITGADEECEGKSQHLEYTERGELKRTWGDTPYPVQYGYDDYGRRTSMKTYRAGSGWNGSSWPGSSLPAATNWKRGLSNAGLLPPRSRR